MDAAAADKCRENIVRIFGEKIPEFAKKIFANRGKKDPRRGTETGRKTVADISAM